MNSFINAIFERIATEATKLATYNKKVTLLSREIQTGDFTIELFSVVLWSKIYKPAIAGKLVGVSSIMEDSFDFRNGSPL